MLFFLSETKLRSYEFDRVRRKCNVEGCFIVDASSRKGGMAMLWMDGCEVNIQIFSLNHIDTLVKIKGEERVRFTRFYGHLEL